MSEIKTYKLPIGSPTSRGKAIINLLPLKAGEKINTLMPYNETDNKNNIICLWEGGRKFTNPPLYWPCPGPNSIMYNRLLPNFQRGGDAFNGGLTGRFRDDFRILTF